MYGSCGNCFAPSAVPTIFMTPAARCEVNFSAFFYQALMPSIKLLLLFGKPEGSSNAE
jgi:hypothetical protein